jgi:hypothetical protein
MDHISIIKRAGQILWDYKILWIFGILLAVTTSSGSPTFIQNNSRDWDYDNFTYQIQPFEDFQEEIQELNRVFEQTGAAEILYAIIAIAIFLLCLAIRLIIITTVVRYVTNTAVMSMVDQYEETGEKLGFRAGWRLGWSRAAWRLFLINLVITFPLAIVFIVLYAVGVGFFLLWLTESTAAGVIGTAFGIGWFFLVTGLLILTVIALSLLKNFFWRACVLDGFGVFDSIRYGYRMARQNFKDVAFMWLIMLGIGVAWVIFLFVLTILIIPLILLLVIVGAILAAGPALITFAITELLLNEVV